MRIYYYFYFILLFIRAKFSEISVSFGELRIDAQIYSEFRRICLAPRLALPGCSQSNEEYFLLDKIF
jgi:hypothetical protein